MKSILILCLFTIGINPVFAQHQHDSIKSQYAGQEDQPIKSLTQDDIDGLKSGAGTPFNGMAKPAELNGYPGPRHVLDAYNSGEFDLSEDQLKRVKILFEEMKQSVIPLGENIIEKEQALDDAFADNKITSEQLKHLVNESASLYAELRFVHLNTHLEMMDILSSEQILKYNELRGYSSSNPCENIPKGHNTQMWKKHNGCN
ncbi:Spy/CpxP family protein refolding chaperone [Gracilimonas sp.]|uniref:Spy/CpxP family protein refolding chaperone n=1 Tax=Gracilimonas sp. TaxID=1974203 RepID=UPI0028726796|nr:hypothetical protein [Gracilimonas sp.]